MINLGPGLREMYIKMIYTSDPGSQLHQFKYNLDQLHDPV